MSESSTPTAEDVAREIAKVMCAELRMVCPPSTIDRIADIFERELSPHFAELAALRRERDEAMKLLEMHHGDTLIEKIQTAIRVADDVVGDAAMLYHSADSAIGEENTGAAAIRLLKDTIQERIRERDEHWISVDEKLPDIGLPVWITLEGGRMLIGGRGVNGGEWHWCNCYGDFYYDQGWKTSTLEMDDDYKVTHWRPLPMALAAAQKGVTG